MRRNRFSMRSAFAFLILSCLAAPSVGQQPYWQRSNTAGAQGPDEADPLRPYVARGGAQRDGRDYPRGADTADRAVQGRANPYAQRHNYFPGQRVGQGPNRNYVPPDRLCVPGRRAFLR